MWFKATGDVHLNSSISQLFAPPPAGTEIKRSVEMFPSSFMLYVICLAGCFECSVVAASAGARGRSLWACVSLSLSLCAFLAGSGLGAGVRGGDYLARLPPGALRVCVFVQH